MNRAFVSALSIGIVVLSWLPSPSFVQEIQPPALRASTLPESLAVDGMLNESAWDTAEATEAFTQPDPTEGGPPAARAVVRVLAGPKALAIGIVCEDPDSGSIVSFSACSGTRRPDVQAHDRANATGNSEGLVS